MDSLQISKTLASVKKGAMTIKEALAILKDLPCEDLSFAKVDHHRHLRLGIPEVIFAAGKKEAEIIAIARAMYEKSRSFLITRATKALHEALGLKEAEFHPASGVISVGKKPKRKKGLVFIVSGGTSDIPVAEEASVTASFLGSRIETAYDIGIAGIHRVLDKKDKLSAARVIIVVAGMEGALPSVVGGLTDRPIIAVPTSIGYGTSLGGLTALFAMLNSCVPGIAVMNIDNGFGAGCLAHKINTL